MKCHGKCEWLWPWSLFCSWDLLMTIWRDVPLSSRGGGAVQPSLQWSRPAAPTSGQSPVVLAGRAAELGH